MQAKLQKKQHHVDKAIASTNVHRDMSVTVIVRVDMIPANG